MYTYIKTTSSAASAPHEILTRIFYMTYSHTRRDSAADLSLACFALVNKKWLWAARDVLYSHVYLGSRLGSSERPAEKTIDFFLRTISGSPELAKSVQAIDFGSLYVVEGETKGLAEVIKLCDNLCEVRLNGWNGYELKDLIYALKSKKTLQVLDINHKSLGNLKCGYFCYLPEFIKMLQGWPELRSVTVWMETVGFDYSGLSYDVDEKAPRAITIIPGACPKLRHLDWRSGCLEQRHLAAISQIAPSLSELKLKEGSMTVRKDLLESLQLCTSRFTHFGLNFYDEILMGNDTTPRVDRNLDAAMSTMPRLCVLDTSSTYLKPADLSHGFTALTILNYRITAEELDGFVSTLSDPSAMPSLCELSLTPRTTRDEFSSALLENMRTLCRRKGIKIRDRSYGDLPGGGIVYNFGGC